MGAQEVDRIASTQALGLVSKDELRPLVVSVVLNWRKPQMTAACVDQLLLSKYPSHQVVIVDNGSADGSFEYLSERFPNVRVLKNEQNEGFSRGCNVGIRHALDSGAAYVSLVNNDLMIEPESLGAAIDNLERHTRHAAVTGKIFWSTPGILWQAGGHIDHRRVMGIPRGFLEADSGAYDEEGTTEWASGAMSTFRAQPLTEVGLLPEEYFFGQEEWAVSTALLRRGYTIGYSPMYVGHHSNGGSYSPHPALNSYGGARNRMLYAETFLSRPRYLVWRTAYLVHLRLRMLRRLEAAGTHDRPELHVRAMRLGVKRHRRGAAVTIEELEKASVDLSIDSSWESK